MICLFCREERPSTIEHVIPDALGGNLTIDRVCATCNGKLGSGADKFLVNHPLSIMRRFELGIASRGGPPPNPFSTLLHEGSLADDPNQWARVEVDPLTGKPTIRIRCSKEVIHSDVGPPIERFVMDRRDAAKLVPTIVQRNRRRAGLLPMSDTDIGKIIEDGFKNGQVLENLTLQHNVVIDVQKYALGLMKVAFECTWIALGDQYLSDPTAALVATSLIESSLQTQLGQATIGAVPSFTFWAEDTHSHICCVVGSSNQIMGLVRIFDVFAGAFIMSRDSQLSQMLTERGGLFLAINPQNGEKRQTTFAEEANRLQNEALEAP